MQRYGCRSVSAESAWTRRRESQFCQRAIVALEDDEELDYYGCDAVSALMVSCAAGRSATADPQGDGPVHLPGVLRRPFAFLTWPMARLDGRRLGSSQGTGGIRVEARNDARGRLRRDVMLAAGLRSTLVQGFTSTACGVRLGYGGPVRRH